MPTVVFPGIVSSTVERCDLDAVMAAFSNAVDMRRCTRAEGSADRGRDQGAARGLRDVYWADEGIR
jgi:hypothetical protein